ncbi:uncharacterized protein Dvir_GJ21293 [Drosophila virilis]|uniref:MD-2-related lipid-recognition domain-containing protein n=1 Tax=Drosophila virilis TaxID=7244 RepID=B4LN88_DROVI|nr:uncharacterized protein Dvir_GJ21293 [Drosophila virilis]
MGIRLIAFGLLLILLALNLCYNAVNFKFTNLVCGHFNESWIGVNQCRLRALSRNMTTLNLNLSLLYSTGRNVQVKGQLFQKASGYKPWLYKVTIDACRFLKKPYHPLAILVYKMFRDYSNLNHTCPFELENLPHAIPTGDYLLKLDWFMNRKLQITTDVYFAFEEDLKGFPIRHRYHLHQILDITCLLRENHDQSGQ